MLACGILRDQRETTRMKKHVLVLAAFAVAALPAVAMAGDAEQANIVPAGAIQLSDDEMDNVSAAGKADAPGQLMKQQLLQHSSVVCPHGNSCNAPGHLFGGASTFTHGHNK